MKEMIPLSLRQRKAFVWWARREYEDYAAIICDGAIRSGKTLAMGMGFFFWAMACFSNRQFALCGRSVGALRRNLLETVLPQLRRLGFACEEKRSEKLLIVRRTLRELQNNHIDPLRQGKPVLSFRRGERGERRADPGHDAGGSAV